jgi:hypothetical protein
VDPRVDGLALLAAVVWPNELANLPLPEEPDPTRCRICGGPLPAPKTGQRSFYCGAECRRLAHNVRNRAYDAKRRRTAA